jgi:hypothetical protein
VKFVAFLIWIPLALLRGFVYPLGIILCVNHLGLLSIPLDMTHWLAVTFLFHAVKCEPLRIYPPYVRIYEEEK